MPNPNDDNHIPSLRSPQKRRAEFPVVGTDPIAGNGRRTMPHDLEQKIDTWQRHGLKILDETRTNSLMVTVGKGMCMVTRDQEKIGAVQVVLVDIDSKRRARDTEENKKIKK